MGRTFGCFPLEACMAPSGMTSIDMPKRKGGKPMNWLNKSTNLCELQSQWNDVVVSYYCSLKWYFWKIHIMLTTLAVKLEVVVVSSCSVCGKSLLLSTIILLMQLSLNTNQFTLYPMFFEHSEMAMKYAMTFRKRGYFLIDLSWGSHDDLNVISLRIMPLNPPFCLCLALWGHKWELFFIPWNSESQCSSKTKLM